MVFPRPLPCNRAPWHEIAEGDRKCKDWEEGGGRMRAIVGSNCFHSDPRHLPMLLPHLIPDASETVQ